MSRQRNHCENLKVITAIVVDLQVAAVMVRQWPSKLNQHTTRSLSMARVQKFFLLEEGIGVIVEATEERQCVVASGNPL